MTRQRLSQELIVAARVGSERAWLAIHDHIHDAVWRATWGYGLSDMEREDAVQETFIRLLKAIHKYDPSRASLATYASVIATRLCIDTCRKKGRASELPIDEAPMSARHAPVPNDDQTFEDMEYLSRALEDDLTPEQRLCVKLHYYRDMSYDDIAVAMGRNYNWVKNTLYKARTILRESIDARRISS